QAAARRAGAILRQARALRRGDGGLLVGASLGAAIAGGITVMGGRRPERHQRAKMVVVTKPSEGKPSMGKSIRNIAAVTRVGLDLAKNAFQVHAVDAKGETVVARKLARGRLVAF